MSGFKISYLPETWQYLAQCTTKPSALWTYALNNFIRQLIIDGNLQLLDRLWLFNADNQQNARVSVVNPTSTQISEMNSPTWTKDVGYKGNGSSTYLNTNYIPSTNGVNFVLNNACMGMYVYSADTLNNCSMGSYGSGFNPVSIMNMNGTHGQYSLNLASSGTNYNDGGLLTSGVGLQAVTNAASGTNAEYYNGTLIQTKTTYSTAAVNSTSFYCLAANENGTPVYFSNAGVGMVFFGSAAINQSKFYNAFNNFLATI